MGLAARSLRCCSPITNMARRNTRPRPGSRNWSNIRPKCSASPTRATGLSGRPSCCACRRPTRRSSCTGMTACCAAGTAPARRPRCTSRSSRSLPIGWQRRLDSREGALLTEVINRTATAHFTGGIPIGDSSKSGAVDPYQRLFGQPGLHVMDGSVMPANPGVNPSLTITALAERAMSLWPNKGDAGHPAALGLRLPARRPGHAAPSLRARRRSGRTATRREEVRHHPRLPVLNRARRQGETDD